MKQKKLSAVVIIIISIYLILPLALTFVYSTFQQWTDILPRGFTFQYFQQIFSDSRFLSSLGRSVLIAIIPILICTLIILLAMYVVVVHLPKLDHIMQILCMVPYAIQGVILAVSILSLYVDAPEPFSDRTVMLVSAYCVMVLPYMYQGVRNSLRAINTRCLLETAEILGAGKLHAFFKIVVPNVLSGIIVSMMLSISMVFGDFVIVNTIGGSYFETAQMYLFKSMSVSGQFSSAMIVILFITTFIISGIIIYFKNRKKNCGR